MTSSPVSFEQVSQDILSFNQVALQGLNRAIALQSNRFALILARCNYHLLEQVLIDHLIERNPTLQVLSLPQHIPSLVEAIQAHLRLNAPAAPVPTALMVTNLGRLENLEAVLKAANLARDTFQQQIPFPLVLWIDDFVLSQMTQFAQDLKNLGPPTLRFETPAAELLINLRREADDLFTRFLKGTPDTLPNNSAINLSNTNRLNNELAYALRDLKNYGQVLDPDLEASLLFAQGRFAHHQLEMETAKKCYRESLRYWEQVAEEVEDSGQEKKGDADLTPALPHLSLSPTLTPLHRKAILLLHLGFWWRSLAMLQRPTSETSLQEARHYFEAGLNCFRQMGQRNLVARFITYLLEVLQKQQDWTALETQSQASLKLHQETGDWVLEASDHGFLAEVALQRQQWSTAQTEAVRALDLLEQAEHRLNENPDNPLLKKALRVAKRFQRGWYRFLLGEAQMELGQPQNAIALLEQARQEVDPEVDLILYRQILDELIQHYYDDLADYRKAFEVKLERQRIEYRHNLRAFIGAAALQPHKQTLSPSLEEETLPTTLSPEIAASGRQQDIENLLTRLQEPRYQIIVIHGPSGVGKSSILNAGLIPALRRITPFGRTTVPLQLQTYGNWEQTLKADLEDILPKVEPGIERNEKHRSEAPTDSAFTSQHALLHTLQAATESNTFVVLVFDQFEDFFFERETFSERQRFYTFLEACLKLPWVKLVLALREDYLHYLLEIEKFADVSILDGGLLSNDVRYSLGNFSPESAEAVIRKLTETAQYYLEDALIHRLVADLAKDTQEVRPIELQVVGAQLERQNITTLSQYEALGEHPKEKLVQRFLHNAIADCGPPNEALAKVVLYLLTDEGKEGYLYRPLKTREDLEYELSFLEVDFSPNQLELVLDILVGSGLLFEIPEDPEDSYQLIHDYLVKYVRQEQTPELLQQLEAAREKQQQTEEELNRVLQERNEILEKQINLQKKIIAVSLTMMSMSLGIGLLTLLTAHFD
ncbi:MAG TPA: AAA family ATPase [Trichocoleus sp.]